jgi:NUDIX domain
MPEIINIHTRENPGKSTPYDRSLFYDEEILRSRSGLPVMRYVEVIHVFLFTESGELIVQKRSKEKRHNPNLQDKSIGGHVQYGDNPNLTAMIEAIQELQVPSIVL